MNKKLFIIIPLLLVLFGMAEAKDLRALRLEKFLERICPTSPLRGRGAEIVRCADKYGLDYRLYIAIAGAESTWGKKSPKRSYNYTGISNGGARFRSVDHNIKFTLATIAEKKWYRKFRKTGDIKDLVYVYKAVPPFDRYLRSLNYIYAMVDAVPADELSEVKLAAQAPKKPKIETIKVAQKAKEPVNLLLAWNSIRYDQFDIRKTISVD